MYSEPAEKQKGLLGADLGVDKTLRGAIDQASATGRAAVAVGPRPHGDERGDWLLYVVQPAWNENANGQEQSADQSEIDGFVLGVFHIGALVDRALTIFASLGIDIFVSTSPAEGKPTPLYTRFSSLHKHYDAVPPVNGPAVPPKGGIHSIGEVDLGSTRWTVDCIPMPSYVAKHRTWGPVGAMLIGFGLTAMLLTHFLVLTGRAAEVERLVAVRTRELSESERRFRQLVDNAGDAFFLRTMRGDILDVNKRACDSLGYTREELLSMNIADVDVTFISNNLGQFASLPDEAYPITFQGVHRRKDGATFPVEVRLSPLHRGEERLMLALVRDIADRKRAEAALRQEQQLLREMLDLHESERKLVAYEIHDGLAQQLTGAIYKFQSVNRLCDNDPAAARTMYDEAVRLLEAALAETRRLIGGLRPPVLDESGIAAAVEYLIAERRQHGGPEITFTHNLEPRRLAPLLESAVFRIVQECLTNACRHSQSPTVHVDVLQSDETLKIEVQDWGVGFDPAEVKGGHFGLQGIHERARLLGGVALIQAAPGQGAHIVVKIPLLPQTEANGGGKQTGEDDSSGR